MRILNFALMFSAAVMVSGCGAVNSFGLYRHQDENTVFATHVEGPVSVAWRNARGEIWLVPKRGFLIEKITDKGRPVPWSAVGSYIVVRGNASQISMFSDGRWYTTPVSWDSSGGTVSMARGSQIHIN